MAQAIKEKSSYTEAFRELIGRDVAGQPEWLRDARGRAIERFEATGFPTTDEEDWKYTNIAPLARQNFRPGALQPAAHVERGRLEPFVYEESRASVLVFVDGLFRAELSSVEGLPTGVEALELAEAARGEHAELLRGRFDAAFEEGDAFAALNTALFDGGLFLHIPANVAVESPVQLLFLASDAPGEAAGFPRVIVAAGPGSSATIIESYAALGEAAYLTNAVTDVLVGEGARLAHYRVQTEDERAFHVSSTRAEIGRTGAYDLTTITLGARLSRHNILVKLDHEEAECWVDGLYLLGDGQHADTHSLIDHRVPRCRSHQNYKGILDGKSRAVFNGRVYVRPGAQQTDAFQSNKNLLLSDEARVDTKPQLEIYADDVKCAHGATVGQLEEEELFYLVSRGLRPALARNLLTYGFAEEIVEKIKVDSIKRQLDEAILNRLHADFEAR